MTLVNRVSTFFLAALAICLAGYSLLSYLLIRQYLYHHFDQEIQETLNVLVAAVEVEADGVKWQPSEHTISVGTDRDIDEVRWLIVDERGQIVDRSRNLDLSSPEDQALFEKAQATQAPQSEAVIDHSWRMLQKELSAIAPLSQSELEFDEFAGVLITVARTTGPLHASLWRLTVLVCLLPAALWLLAAIGGRAYCRRALHPVSDMAARARSMTTADFQLRLPAGDRHDELADLALAFNGLLDQLQQAFEQQRRFTGDAAHQLRTPLTVLRGQIEVALRRPRDAKDYRDVLATLQAQTEELQQLVETLLYLARAEAETVLPETQSIVLADWIPAALNRWREHPRYRDLKVDLDPSVRLTVSPSLFSQAFENLIDNAMKYSPAGSPITIRTLRQDNAVGLRVEDEGIGVAEDDRERIFHPFYRSLDARQTGVEGTGLGLALVARIARSHGGGVDCENNSPHGTRFTIWFPRDDADA